jgi:hypothetical protein
MNDQRLWEMNEQSSSSSFAVDPPMNVSRSMTRLCSNCGQFGHHTCKRQFSDIERIEINGKVAKYKLDRTRKVHRPEPKSQDIATMTTPNRKPSFKLCARCAEEGHLQKNCSALVSESPETTQSIAMLYSQRKSDHLERRKNEAREADRLRHARLRQTPDWKAQQLQRENDPEWVTQTRKTREALKRIASDNEIVRPICLTSKEELARVDKECDFDCYKRSDRDIYRETCPRLSYDFLVNNCCIVCCACDVPKALTRLPNYCYDR